MNQLNTENLLNTEQAANTANTGNFMWVWIAVGLAVLLFVVVAAILLYKRRQRIKKANVLIQSGTPAEKEAYINKLIEPSGFLFDEQKDIFYAMKKTWQKRYGYCRMYDEAAPLFNMVIDCEPIYFDYDGKNWMLEFWKGQYGMTTGGEVGLYLAKNNRGKFYKGVGMDDYIGMQMELFRRGVPVFERQESHWWLTGFRLGECSAPKELKMVVTLTFPNRLMTQRFVEGLRKAGYAASEYQVQNEKVKILFYTPHTKQPSTRGPVKDRVRLLQMRLFCRMYRAYTRKYVTTSDKLIALQAKAPRLFTRALRIGKTVALFERIGENENSFKD